MVGSKVICFAAMREVAATTATQAKINQPHPPPSQGIANPGAKVQLHLDLIHAPHIVGSVQLPLIRNLILPRVAQPRALHGFQSLLANLGLKGVIELLNNMYNIVRHQNSHVIKERIFRKW